MSNSEPECKSEPGTVRPVIDLNRCEAQSDCVRVCPCNVFVIKPISQHEKAQLSLRGKIKTWVHGSNKAYADNAQDCRACALCITACPENAITLQKIG